MRSPVGGGWPEGSYAAISPLDLSFSTRLVFLNGPYPAWFCDLRDTQYCAVFLTKFEKKADLLRLDGQADGYLLVYLMSNPTK